MQNPGKPLGGVYAAVTTPRDSAYGADTAALKGNLEFLMERGIRGFVVNGATGEYCSTSPGELARILPAVADQVGGKARFLCGIGAADYPTVLENGRVAAAAGAEALLLPMPHFFPYRQEDVFAFCAAVAGNLSTDILLYNLPQFTTGFTAATLTRLVRQCPTIRGIKDSSGSLDLLHALTAAHPDAVRIVGNDKILPSALRQGACDGVISGVAGVLPELILRVYEEGGGDSEAIERLDEFIAWLDEMPVPWGLKWTAQARGMAAGCCNLPLSGERREQASRFQEWFRNWAGQQELSDTVARLS